MIKLTTRSDNVINPIIHLIANYSYFVQKPEEKWEKVDLQESQRGESTTMAWSTKKSPLANQPTEPVKT